LQYKTQDLKNLKNSRFALKLINIFELISMAE